MLHTIRLVVLDAAKGLYRNDVLQLSASLAYYSLLSIAPLLLVVIAVAGLLFAEGTVRTQLLGQIGALVGPDGAEFADTVLDNTESEDQSWQSLLLGTALTLFGATTVFGQLQKALNRIWAVSQDTERAALRHAIWAFVRHRLLSFALVLVIGFLLMVSLVISALLSGLHERIDAGTPGAAFAWQAFNIVLSFGLATILLGLMFKYLPDVEIDWRDTWLGAAITAVLFAAGKWAIGLYLGQASLASSFGAAGSAVVFMVWVYYASLIVFFGAAITRATAERRRVRRRPLAHARSVPDT